MPPSTHGIKNPTPGAKNGKAVPAKPPPTKKASVSAAKKAPPSAPTKIPAPSALTKIPPVHKPPVLNVDQVELALGNFARHSEDKEYAGVTRHSKEHDRRCKKFEGEFIISTTVGQKDILGDWLTTMVTSPQDHKVPNLFKACAGEKSLAKKQLVGKMGFLLDFT